MAELNLPSSPETNKSVEESDAEAKASMSQITDTKVEGASVEENKGKRLSGAARKRYYWFMRQGFNHEEAREKCLKPMPIQYNKEAKKAKNEGKVSKPMEVRNFPSHTFKRGDEEESGKPLLKTIPRTSDAEAEAFKSQIAHCKVAEASFGDPRPEEGSKEKRLSGAGRKRYNWYRRKGFSHEEAREKSLSPMQAFKKPPEKRVRPAGTTFEDNKEPKKVKNEVIVSKIGEKGNSPPITFRQTVVGIKMGILHKDYPETLLSTEQLRLVQEGILEAIVELKDEDIKPNFLNASFKSGWLSVLCGDQETVEWLTHHCETTTPWENAALKAVEEKFIPRSYIAVAYLPSAEDSNTRILDLIRGQNRGLNTEEWRILSRKDEDTMAHLTFSIDEASKKSLEDLGKINFKFGQVNLRLKGKSPYQREDSEDEDMKVDVPQTRPSEEFTKSAEGACHRTLTGKNYFDPCKSKTDDSQPSKTLMDISRPGSSPLSSAGHSFFIQNTAEREESTSNLSHKGAKKPEISRIPKLPYENWSWGGGWASK